jgi:hypothetical protein
MRVAGTGKRNPPEEGASGGFLLTAPVSRRLAVQPQQQHRHASLYTGALLVKSSATSNNSLYRLETDAGRERAANVRIEFTKD